MVESIRSPLSREHSLVNALPAEGRANNCCSCIMEKIHRVWTWCTSYPSSNVEVPRSPTTVPLFYSSLDEQHSPRDTISRSEANLQEIADRSMCEKITSATLNFLNHPGTITTLLLASATGIVVSGTLVSFELTDFCTACIDQLNELVGNLDECKAPFQSNITIHESDIAACCFMLGYVMQVLFGSIALSIESTQQNSLSTESTYEHTTFKIKSLMANAQNNFSYELQLFCGSLYGGLWTAESNGVLAWDYYYHCQTSGIGMASAFLGMYTRIKYLELKRYLFEKNICQIPFPTSFHLKDHWKMITVTVVSVSLAVVTVSSHTPFSSSVNPIVQDISVMVLVRPIGTLCTGKINQLHFQNSIKNPCLANCIWVLSTCLTNLRTPLLVAGFYIYANSLVEVSHPLGMSMVGFVHGAKDSCYQFIEGPESVPITDVGAKIPLFIKNYWRTMALVSFAIASTKLHFLDCYSIEYYECPIGFELAKNFIVVDGEGVNIAIAAGLGNYYIRKLSKFIKNKTHGSLQQIPHSYLYLTDKYQYDLLSLIPYAIIKYGEYIPDYHDYACYNPQGILILLGITMGTYKEKVNSGDTNDPFRPIFTDTSVLTSAML